MAELADVPKVELPRRAHCDARATPLPLWRHMLGAELRRLRSERAETLGETARRAGVSPQYLSEMERGIKDPSSEMIDAVAGALGVTLIDLTRSVADELQTLQGPGSRGAFVLAA